jgi:hypothetical protein
VHRLLASSRVAIFATLAACATSGATTGLRSQPDQITAAEITASGTTNAWDLISRVRPNWLRQRGTASIGGSYSTTGDTVGRSPMSANGANNQVIVVYLDGHRYGDISTLRTLSTSGLKSLRWLDASSAAATLTDVGSDPIAGAIVVTSR